MNEGYLYGQVGKLIITNYDTRHLVKFPNIVKKKYMDKGASGEPVLEEWVVGLSRSIFFNLLEITLFENTPYV